jgi:hypothetical protein
MTPENAEILALEALGWLAGEDDAIQRFLGSSGIDPAELRQAAGNPDTGAAVLDFLMGDEELLLRFCEHAQVSPKQLHLARYRLGGTAE